MSCKKMFWTITPSVQKFINLESQICIMITKERLLKSIAEMPDNINVDDLLDQVLFIQKIETGILQSAQNRTQFFQTRNETMVQINWTERAKEDLRNIAEFISHDSVYYAEKQLDKMYESVEILYEHSEIGRPVPEYELQNLRQLLVGKYRLIYLIVNDSRIDIITVHHSARILNLEI